MIDYNVTKDRDKSLVYGLILMIIGLLCFMGLFFFIIYSNIQTNDFCIDNGYNEGFKDGRCYSLIENNMIGSEEVFCKGSFILNCFFVEERGSQK